MNAPQNINQKDKYLWEKFKASTSGKNKSPCPENNALAAYLEGTASEQQVQTMEEHLAECSACMDGLLELKLILQEKPKNPPLSIIERAKRLVPAPVKKEPRFALRLPGWLKNLIPDIRSSLGYAAAIALIVIGCFAGMKFGQDTFVNRRQISAICVSEITFGLSDAAGLGFGDSEFR